AIAAYSRHGVKVVGKRGDLADLDAYPKLLTDIADELGGCDIFIPSASASGSKLAGDWEACFRMDVLGTVRGCEALHGYLAQSQNGSVVILASTAATETFVAPQAFNAMKASLLTYSGQLAQAWGSEGIRVNAVSPGPVFFEGGNWDDVKNAMPEFFAKIEADHALGRMGTVDDVAKTIVFLASPASAWTTGTNVIVDGGFTKRVHF